MHCAEQAGEGGQGGVYLKHCFLQEPWLQGGLKHKHVHDVHVQIASH